MNFRKNYYDSEKELWEVNNTKKDSILLLRLSKWIKLYYGNVNVAQRLNIIRIVKKVRS